MDEEPVKHSVRCDQCDQPFRTTQGLAGHRRLAHPSGTSQEHEVRESELRARELVLHTQQVELARRQIEIEETGPAALGMFECNECGSWFKTDDKLRRHARTQHPIERAAAVEVGVNSDRVLSVWREAARKAERHPSESPEQIVQRFWDGTDQDILRALLARNAAFRSAKGGS